MPLPAPDAPAPLLTTREIAVHPRAALADLKAAGADLEKLLLQYDPDDWKRKQPDLAVLRALGERLFALAFPEAAQQEALLSALGQGPLRLGLHAEVPRLATLPWEYMCLPAGLAGDTEALGWPPGTPPFLALHPQVSLVRRGARALRPGVRDELGTLRLLAVWSNPECQHWPWAAVQWDHDVALGQLRGVATSHLQVEAMPGATLTALEKRLVAYRPHLLHFTGHGGYPKLDDPGDLQKPSLVLQPEPGDGCHAYLTAQTLATLCRDHGVRAVVLNSCWGGRGLHSLAGALTAAGVPVVLAMQLPLLVSAAVGLSMALYAGLAIGRSFEECLQVYRGTCIQTPFGLGVPDWGVPVLHLGVEDSRLFRTTTVDPYPIDFRPLLGRHIPIVGRGFLFERIAAWRVCRTPELD